MKINIKVIPNSKENSLTIQNDQIIVKINAPAVDGKANKELIKFLSEYYKVKKSKIKIIKGEKSRYKIISIEN
jgi:uncharacterized protein (TIGR00251 family)